MKTVPKILGKKGLNWIGSIRIGIMVVFAFCIYLIVTSTAQAGVRVFAAEQMVLDRLLFNSAAGFSYKDSQGRVHEGVVDLSKFDQAYLSKAYNIPIRAGLKLHLYSIQPHKGPLVDKYIFINEEYASLGGGFSGASSQVSTEPVLIKREDDLINGAIEVTYVFKR